MGFFVFPSITIYPLRLFSSISVQRIFVGGGQTESGRSPDRGKDPPPLGSRPAIHSWGEGFPGTNRLLRLKSILFYLWTGSLFIQLSGSSPQDVPAALSSMADKRLFSLPAATGLVGIVLLGVGLSLVYFRGTLVRERGRIESRIATERQVFQALESLDPAALSLGIPGPGGSLPPSGLSGWSAQMHSVLRSLSRQSFPWRPADREALRRIDKDYRSYVRTAAVSPPNAREERALLRKVETGRRLLLRSASAITREAEDRLRGIERLQGRLEDGIFGIGLAAFALFSFSVLTHRRSQKLLRRLARSESYLSTLLESLPVALFFKDTDGRWRTANRAGLALFDLEGKDWRGKTDLEIAAENPFFREALENCHEQDRKVRERNQELRSLERVPRPDGTSVPFETIRIPIRNPDGSPLGLLVSGYDLTERLRHEESLALYRRIFDAAHEGITIADENGNILECNPAFSRITGYAPEEVRGQNPRFLQSGRHDRTFYRAMWEAITGTGYWEGEIWNRRKSGELYCEWLEIAPLKRDGEVFRYIGIFFDITRRKEDEERIFQLAFHDPLTNLVNRRTFRQKIDELLLRASREPDLRFAVGILDLDGFKEINDRLGHPAGDDLLVQVSRRLEGVLRSTDTVARLGGDEFGLLLTPFEEDGGLLFERILDALRLPFDIGPERITIAGSLGVAFFPGPDSRDPDLLLSHADLALYRVKTRGRNGWAPFEAEMEERIGNRHRIRKDLDMALVKGNLLLHFQPKIQMTTGRILGMEALVRWNHPERGLLPPDSFIDVAEKSDLIAPLGRFVLAEALAQQNRWRDRGIDLPVSVNIGARHFFSDSFRKDLESALSPYGRNGILPRGLEIEIAETSVAKDLSRAREIVLECRALGVAVALDDFGTGQASLTALQRLSPGAIKIDRGFVEKIRKGEKERALLESVIMAGHRMGLEVVAEGVETEEEGLLLIGMGCTTAQGFAIAPPMAPERIPDWRAGWTAFRSWQKAGSGNPVPGETP